MNKEQDIEQEQVSIASEDRQNEEQSVDNETQQPSSLKELHLLIAKKQIKVYDQKLRFIKRSAERYQMERVINTKKVLYQFYIFLVSCVVLALSSSAYLSQEVHLAEIKEIIQNWNQEILVELNYTITNKDCKLAFGEDYENFATYIWPGTEAACDCTVNNKLNDTLINSDQSTNGQFFSDLFIVNKVCSTKQIKANCETIQNIPEKKLGMWIEGQFGIPFTLCSKRAKNVTFLNNKMISGQCDANLKACNKSQICVPLESKCPISRIGFEKDEFYTKIKNGSLEGDILDINDILSIYFMRDDQSAISEVRISEAAYNQTVCTMKDNLNISPGRLEYPLMLKQRRECKQDPYFQSLHTISEEQFYLANNVLYLKQILPYYQINSNYNWGIFVKQYIDWDDNCRGDILNSIVEVSNSIGIIYVSLRYMLIITIIYFIIIGLILPSLGLSSAFNQYITFMASTRKQQYSVIFLYEILIKSILECGEMAVIGISYATVYNKQLAVDKALNSKCSSDIIVNSVFKAISGDVYDFIWSYNLAILVIFSSVLALDCYLLIDAMSKKQIQTLEDWKTDLKKFIFNLIGRQQSARVVPALVRLGTRKQP